MRLYDMHCHASFAPSFIEHIKGLERLGISALCATVSPEEYLSTKSLLHDYTDFRQEAWCCCLNSSIVQGQNKSRSHLVGRDSKHCLYSLGIGFHPWWIDRGICGVRNLHAFDEALQCTDRFAQDFVLIAEIGLDFSSVCRRSAEEQVTCFRHILNQCKDSQKHITMSLHCVKSDDVMLSEIEKSGLVNQATIIMHSYGGSCEGLHRAIEQGCYFSVSSQFMQSKRGREYAKIIPSTRLLVESDRPSSSEDYISPQEIQVELGKALSALADIRGKRMDEEIFQTSEDLFHDMTFC